jgi:hypothetical protein
MKLSMFREMFSIGKLILGFNKLEQILVAGVSHLNCALTETASIKLQEWSYEYGYEVLPRMCCHHISLRICIIVFIAAVLYIIHTIHLHVQLMY